MENEHEHDWTTDARNVRSNGFNMRHYLIEFSIRNPNSTTNLAGKKVTRAQHLTELSRSNWINVICNWKKNKACTFFLSSLHNVVFCCCFCTLCWWMLLSFLMDFIGELTCALVLLSMHFSQIYKSETKATSVSKQTKQCTDCYLRME